MPVAGTGIMGSIVTTQSNMAFERTLGVRPIVNTRTCLPGLTPHSSRASRRTHDVLRRSRPKSRRFRVFIKWRRDFFSIQSRMKRKYRLEFPMAEWFTRSRRIGLMSLSAPCATRSRMAGMERRRTLPPSLGISRRRGWSGT